MDILKVQISHSQTQLQQFYFCEVKLAQLIKSLIWNNGFKTLLYKKKKTN